MAKINVKHPTETLRTHEGAPAKHINTEQQLRRSVMACLLWEDTFYESGVEIAKRISDLVNDLVKAGKSDAVAAMAIEARERMKLRHVPLMLCRELARYGSLQAETLTRVIQRADELTEFLAIYWKDGREPVSAQAKRGLAHAFGKFDAYQLAKYDREGAVRLRDVMFLCHPKPKDKEQAKVWNKLADGTLESPDTWEVALSGGADKRETWTRLLTERKLGALALLRNLRNMLGVDVDRKLIAEAITDMNAARVLPFRFISAALHAPQFERVLETKMFESLAEMPSLSGHVALLIDVSGSMNAPISQRSQVKRIDVAAALGMLLAELCEEGLTVVAFATEAKVVPPRRGFALRDALRLLNIGYGTNMAYGKKLADKEGYDRIIIVSDEQSHQALPSPKGGVPGYMINVASYRNGIGYGAWTHIDGWSEAVIDYIQEYERSQEK